MKLLKNLLLIGVIFIGYTTQAQVKIAHINTDELVQAMPETKQMRLKSNNECLKLTI